MTLREEPLTTKVDMPFTSCGSAIDSNLLERARIEMEIDIFLRKGGQITQCGNGMPVCEPKTDVQRKMEEKRAKEKRATVQTPLSFMDGKNRAHRRSESGFQNIQLNHKKDGLSYTVVLGGMNFGTFKDVADAIKKRDAQRDILGIGKADY